MSGKGGRNGNDDGGDRALSLKPRQGGSPAAPFWLSTNKVTVPDRVAGYVHRADLLQRMQATRRRVTILKAPGGFGKTVLLAESCRNLRHAGVIVAWLTVDANDAPQALDTYFAFAFEQAGMNILDVLEIAGIERNRTDALENRAQLLGMAIEQHGAPCVLVLDELEQLVDGMSVALVDRLLKWGPTNLHVAIGCREIPETLDIASTLLAGDGEIFAADAMRFSRPDIAEFMGPEASRRVVASLANASRGWPIALRLLRNERFEATRDDADDGSDIADNWVASRLFRGLSEADRELLLDVGLFEWIDAGLLDEVLENGDAKRRVEAMPVLAGLLETVPGRSSTAVRLHPLIREHCARRRFRETPDRFRRIHRRIAETLARQGNTVIAMRHASQAGDLTLMGEILETAGGLRLWLREGRARLQAADRLLSAELLERRPRLALVRCMVALLTGRLGEARQSYRALAARHPVSAGNPDGEDIEYRLDDLIVQGMLVIYGCDSTGSEQVKSLMADVERVAAIVELDPLVRAAVEHSLCLAAYLGARFDAALDHGERALRYTPAGHFLEVYIELLRGQIAMARGEIAQASHRYRRTLERVREDYLGEQAPATTSQVLMAELNLERNRVTGIQTASAGSHGYFARVATFTVCAAHAGVTLDLTRHRDGIDQALSIADGMLDFARNAGLPMLVRVLAAERVSLLVAGGRIAEAERAWRLDGLPKGRADCLDLETQSWLELESVACAKLRLLIVRGEFEAARGFLGELVELASKRDLWRTRMRALALGIALEQAAGRPAEAERHLGEYLRLYAMADYARPLLRERTACLPTLEAFVANNADSAAVGKARRLLTMLNEAEVQERNGPSFTTRELDVLQRLERCSDKDIAKALALTRWGVRYHVRNIFVKLDVRDRRSAVRRARDIGLLT